MEHAAPTTQDSGSDGGNASVIFQGDYQRIFRYIKSMIRDEAEAEDLTQETFLRAFRRRDTLREEAAQTAWLYRIATHVSLDRLRRYARRSPLESEADPDETELADPNSPSLQHTLERDEMSGCVQAYLNGLPDSYRAVILLHDMHDLTAQEIAQVLGESLPTVKIRLHRARIKLKAALQVGCDFSYDDSSTLTCESKD